MDKFLFGLKNALAIESVVALVALAALRMAGYL